MKKGRMIWAAVLALILLVGGLGTEGPAGAAAPEIQIVREQVGDGKLFLPQLAGLSDLERQATLNSALRNAVLAFINPSPDSTLKGDFTRAAKGAVSPGVHIVIFSCDAFLLRISFR